MWILNSALGALFDVLLYPFRGLPPVVGLLVVSVLASIGMLYVFKWTSDQEAMEETKRQIHAGIFEIRLFSDDMRAIFRAQLDIMRHNLTYFRLSLAPVAWMIVPFVLLVVQLQFHYGYAPPRPGEPLILKVKLRSDAGPVVPAAAGDDASGPDLRLVVPEGVRVDSPMLWIGGENEADWRVVPEEPGHHELEIHAAGETLTKTLTVSDLVVRRSPVRPSTSVLDQLVWPVEPPVPADSAVESIELTYEDASVSLLGLEMHWIIAFFILTIAIAFALRKPFGVTI